MSGWAEGPGGGMLAGLIAGAFHRAEQRDRDNEPCPTCGGDKLRRDFTGSGRCHAPLPALSDPKEEQNNDDDC